MPGLSPAPSGHGLDDLFHLFRLVPPRGIEEPLIHGRCGFARTRGVRLTRRVRGWKRPRGRRGAGDREGRCQRLEAPTSGSTGSFTALRPSDRIRQIYPTHSWCVEKCKSGARDL